MKKFLAALLLWPLLAAAQPGNFPPLIGARGTTNPTNCSVGQLFFRSDVTAGQNIYGCTAVNTWTAQGSSSGGITIGQAVTGGTAYAVIREDGSSNLAATSALLFGSAAAGHGLQIAAGTAITDVAALSVTRTNNNAAVATGVQFTFTDTTSAAGFLPFQVLGGVGGVTNLFSLSKTGSAIFGSNVVGATLQATTAFTVNNGGQYQLVAAFAQRTAPTVASGGCTSPTAVTSNGTAAFSVGVGTSCSGSQPLVFTLPPASTGWNCYARNSTNAATSSPAQTSAVSTTSVTITNFSRTLGTAAAWTDADNVVVSCLGY